MFTRICVSLDRLCNTNFTPSAAVSTLSVVSSAPALAMEEALPISVSTETQKTPEEVCEMKEIDDQIYAKSTKVLKGESEKDQDERERERRVNVSMRIDVQAKKARRHAKRVQQENELIEKSKVDEKARKILENRKIKESLEVFLYE